MREVTLALPGRTAPTGDSRVALRRRLSSTGSSSPPGCSVPEFEFIAARCGGRGRPLGHPPSPCEVLRRWVTFEGKAAQPWPPVRGVNFDGSATPASGDPRRSLALQGWTVRNYRLEAPRFSRASDTHVAFTGREDGRRAIPPPGRSQGPPCGRRGLRSWSYLIMSAQAERLHHLSNLDSTRSAKGLPPV